MVPSTKKGSAVLNIVEKAKRHPLISLGAIFFAGFSLAIGIYVKAADIFGFSVIRSDDYIKIDLVRREYVTREIADQLKQEIERLELANKDLEKNTELSEDCRSVISRVEPRPAPFMSDTSKKFCDQTSREIKSVQQEKAALDTQIERLISSGGSTTYVSLNNEPTTTYQNEREISEKKRKSDGLRADIVALRGQLVGCSG